MGAVEVFLKQLDDAWAHPWESIAVVLTDVGEAESEWQAPCYRTVEREEGWPAPGTILWQVAHLAHCKEHYAAILRHRADSAAPPAPARKPYRTFGEEMLALKVAHAGERAALAEIGDEELGRPVLGKMPLGEFIAMILRHDAWHAGQIAMARRLFRER
ncbi:MAG: DinB family protein [Planctomycetaceae bacterium]